MKNSQDYDHGHRPNVIGLRLTVKWDEGVKPLDGSPLFSLCWNTASIIFNSTLSHVSLQLVSCTIISFYYYLFTSYLKPMIYNRPLRPCMMGSKKFPQNVCNLATKSITTYYSIWIKYGGPNWCSFRIFCFMFRKVILLKISFFSKI